MTHNGKTVRKTANSEKKLLRSLSFAWRGVTDLARHEPTFKYFIIAFLLVLVAILYFEPTKAESAVLILAAVFVFTLEFINSLFERLLDIVEPKDDERVRHIKDVMAGLVLLASIGAALVGLIVLLPYAYALWVI